MNAKIITRRLTDGSKVYSVQCEVGFEIVEFHCIGKDEAENLQKVLEFSVCDAEVL
jgi:hypothetical protein